MFSIRFLPVNRVWILLARFVLPHHSIFARSLKTL